MPEYVLTTNNLTKKFGRNNAVSSVNMHVEKGDIYGLIGENGAGKTTIMRMIVGLASVSEGEIELFQNKDLDAGRKRLGCVIENPAYYPNMTARENLETFRRMIGDNRPNIVDDILKIIRLSDIGKKKVKNFSLGMKQRLSIGISLLGNPDLLVLDEPINGLDPTGIMDVRDLIVRLSKEENKTIIISSHILEELSKVANRYGIIKKGVLVEEISTMDLQKDSIDSIKLVVNDSKRASAIIADKFVDKINIIDDNTLIVNCQAALSANINKELVLNDIMVSEISVAGMQIENHFVEIMRGGNK